MPYRAELRRPDLKGVFKCSLCNKVFCHSSSLSRHRMQAHFKSYTCTLCNKEITSNETLRSHMYRKHQISRMFMCRCCNWAFPDKTSLHIHVQAMSTNSTSGDVNIIAKSTSGLGGAGSPGILDAGSEPDEEFFRSLQVEEDSPERSDQDEMKAPDLSSPSGLNLASMLHPGDVERETSPFEDKEDARANRSGGGVRKSRTFYASRDELFKRFQNVEPGSGPGSLASGIKLNGSSSLMRSHVSGGSPLGCMNPLETDTSFSDGNNNINGGSGGFNSDADMEAHEHTPDSSEGTSEDHTGFSPVKAESLMPPDDEHGENGPNSDFGRKMANLEAGISSLKSAVAASPMNSLLYKKRLSTALRKGDRAHHPHPYHQRQSPTPGTPVNLSGKSSSRPVVKNEVGDDVSSTIDAVTSQVLSGSNDALSPKSHISNSNSSSSQQSSPPSDKKGPSLPPSSLAQPFGHHHQAATSPFGLGQPPPPLIMPGGQFPANLANFAAATALSQKMAAASSASLLQPCYMCGVVRAQMNLMENRNQILKKDFVSAQSEARRQANEIGTLQANARRYETEGRLLKSHCEQLEQKILAFQEKSLEFLGSAASAEPEAARVFLQNLLEQCKIHTVVSNSF